MAEKKKFQIPVRNASTLPLDLVDQLDLHVAQRSEDPASQPFRTGI
jgi:hypothetical protein